jgi:hypothetical protein
MDSCFCRKGIPEDELKPLDQNVSWFIRFNALNLSFIP